MRAVTNSTLDFYRRSQSDLGRLRGSAERLQNQLATGERLERSSDDPVAASRLRTLDRLDKLGAIDTSNARRASEDLQLAGVSLESAANDIIRARELAIWASSDAIGDTERSAIATEIEELRQSLFSTANTFDSGGSALFAGEAGGVAYVEGAGGVISYAGSAEASTIELGQGQSVVRGLTGPEVFEFTSSSSGTSDIFAHLATLALALRGGVADPAQAARDSLADFDNALESVTRSQTTAGSRDAWLEVVQDRHADQSLTRAQQSADAGGVDLTSAITELQQVLTILEASQASFARVSSLSLFNQI